MMKKEDISVEKWQYQNGEMAVLTKKVPEKQLI